MSEVDWEKTGETIAAAREQRGYSVGDLATRAGLSTKTVYQAESGLARLTQRTINKLEAALNVTGVLQYGDSPPRPPTFYDSHPGESLVLTNVRVEQKEGRHYIAIDTGVPPDVFVMAASAAEAVIVASKRFSEKVVESA